jgi:glycosyltransferase involved in cell wall biosynthesis
MRFSRRKDPTSARVPKNAKVSVVLASYNHEEFVAAAVESVLGQTHENLELIVVDDASPDGTADVVAGIKDPRLRLVRNPKNRVAHPRNTGLKLASGDLVAFQNSDDVWAPTKLSEQVARMEDPANSAVFTRVQMIDQYGAHSPDAWVRYAFKGAEPDSAAWLRRFFDTGNDFCISSAMCRRTDLENLGGFNPALIQLSDLDLWVRLAAIGKLEIVEEELTSMRVVAGRNLSAPSPAVEVRASWEHATILDRYAEAPIRGMIPDIFPEFGGRPRSGPVRLALLARYAMRHPGFAQRVFGDRLFARLLSDPGGYDRIVEALGVKAIQEFYRKRGNLVVSS